jgi:hypothetical protein
VLGRYETRTFRPKYCETFFMQAERVSLIRPDPPLREKEVARFFQDWPAWPAFLPMLAWAPAPHGMVAYRSTLAFDFVQQF